MAVSNPQPLSTRLSSSSLLPARWILKEVTFPPGREFCIPGAQPPFSMMLLSPILVVTDLALRGKAKYSQELRVRLPVHEGTVTRAGLCKLTFQDSPTSGWSETG